MAIADDIRQFLNEPYFGVLATTNPDGSSQQTLMWYALIGNDILMNTAAGRRKHQNIDRRPSASLCIVDGRRYLTVAGPAGVEPDDPALHRTIGLRYVDPTELDRLFATAYDRQERVTIRLRITSVIDGRNV